MFPSTQSWDYGVMGLWGFRGFFFVRRFVSIHPESLFSDILKRMTADPVIQVRQLRHDSGPPSSFFLFGILLSGTQGLRTR